NTCSHLQMTLLRYRKGRCSASSVLAALVLTFSASALAATSTWTGGGAPSVNWSLAANWTPGAPTSSQTTDLIFAGTTNTGTSGTPLNNDLAGSVGTGSIVAVNLNATAFSSGGGAFFLGGNNLRLDGTGTNPNSITQNSSSAESIANTITSNGI